MEKKHRIISADNKLEFGINKLLSMLMLAACLVFVLIETRDARYSNALFLVLIFAALGIVGLFLGDLLMVLVDPRISLNRGEGSREWQSISKKALSLSAWPMA